MQPTPDEQLHPEWLARHGACTNFYMCPCKGRCPFCDGIVTDIEGSTQIPVGKKQTRFGVHFAAVCESCRKKRAEARAQ